ncbi:MAG: hypothetical protein U0074_02755 [Kouleothrix sp.]
MSATPPLLPAPQPARRYARAARLKLENLQVTGSFKARGVFNTLLQLNTRKNARAAWSRIGWPPGRRWPMARGGSVFPLPSSSPRTPAPTGWRDDVGIAQVRQHGDVWDDAHAAAQPSTRKPLGPPTYTRSTPTAQ